MEVEVRVISTEIIKPSLPTPDHLRSHRLSFLDQISPPIFMPLVEFYGGSHGDTTTSRCDGLKRSLSQALTRFYPLAGRVRENHIVDCNDEGIPFVQARVHCQLSEFLEDARPGQLNRFLPYKLDDVRDLPAAVQVNFFDCGGIAIGLCISHKIADALSFFTFLNSWAAIARGDTDIIQPRFGSATIFPPINISGFKPSVGIIKENIVTKRFVFNASNISALREKYADKTNIENPRRPTRIEALSAFIWGRFMAATQEEFKSKRLYSVLHAVNLRTRMDPPLPDYYFGNISRTAIAFPSLDSKEDGYGVVSLMRDEIKKINKEYVEKLKDGEGHLSFLKERAQQVTKGELLSFSFTSLCRFPLYEADFGWGKPLWVGSASLTYKNLVTFFDTRSGDGIEAWVNLTAEDMEKLEIDKELLAYTSSPPVVRVC